MKLLSKSIERVRRKCVSVNGSICNQWPRKAVAPKATLVEVSQIGVAVALRN